MKEARIKGSIFMMAVKVLKKSKDERLFKYLKPEDREIISRRIFPAGWYPLESFWRILTALYEIIGGENPEVAREWGRNLGIQIFTNIYKDQLVDERLKDPSSLLRFICGISETFFSHTRLQIVSIEPGKANLQIQKASSHPASRIFYLMLCGTLEKLVAKAGGKNPRVQFAEGKADAEKTVNLIVTWD